MLPSVGWTHGELHLLALVLDVERPPALDALVFEERHLRDAAVLLQHVERALLRGLGAAWELVQIQCQRACVKKSGVFVLERAANT